MARARPADPVEPSVIWGEEAYSEGSRPRAGFQQVPFRVPGRGGPLEAAIGATLEGRGPHGACHRECAVRGKKGV
jgi:hypothetical protein